MVVMPMVMPMMMGVVVFAFTMLMGVLRRAARVFVMFMLLFVSLGAARMLMVFVMIYHRIHIYFSYHWLASVWRMRKENPYTTKPLPQR
ncbi:hypothetical protein PORCRE_1109 [Porphyromonas crevioricanis JCM 15906]|uniref:Uncharacterized protein n=1 Tax=Porphyromonas crevioricanis JCM 15906 TaxID=1305617 RepID=T1CQQ0_9PORP|nr:hypothetical protein PORCRE_1109 [Porphyromonas crevioricanis JCM 15906]